MNLRLWMARALWMSGISLGIGVLSAFLSLVLGAVGDRVGAEAVHGVTIVAMTGFSLAFMSLVAVLAVNELTKPERDRLPSKSEGKSLE